MEEVDCLPSHMSQCDYYDVVVGWRVGSSQLPQGAAQEMVRSRRPGLANA